MRLPHPVSTALAAALCLAVRASAAPTAGQVWNEVFNADEQRIIHAIKADPQADEALKAGLRRVVSSALEAVEAEKKRFQSEWLARIETFAKTYKPGQGQGGVKPTVASMRDQLPWLAKIDQDNWGGQVMGEVTSRMDAFELSFNVAQLRSISPEAKEQLTDKLGKAKFFRYSAAGVAEEMVKTGREAMASTLAGLSADTPARLATVRQQLESAERLLADARRTQTPVNGGSVFDGSRRAPGAPAPGGGSVVDARPNPPAAPGEAPAAPKPPEAPAGERLSPAPPPPAAPSGPLTARNPSPDEFEVPPPKTPGKDEQTYASKAGAGGGGIGSSIMGVLKSPVGKGGMGGGLLGAIAGFFIGGPIGAVIGLLVGAAAGAGVMMASGSSSPQT
ncbi:MAG: hypothetical protein HY928_10035 [Elusimicrobia bacterium]|nr:hypothetical protein [Elusimicrobiota bacterium]